MKRERAINLVKRYIKEKEGRDNLTIEDAGLIQALIEGVKYTKCRMLCEDRYGINLMTDCAFLIMQEVYGKQLTKMKPDTLISKLTGLMRMVDGDPDEDIIKETIKDYLNE